METTRQIRPIKAEHCYALRQQVLRPNQDLKACQYPGDLEEDSVHLGLFIRDDLKGIASMYNQDENETRAPGQWRIRGMAVVPEHQGQGLGSLLLKALIEEAKARKARRLWCNARSSAVAFYSKHGLLPHGEEFEIHPIGPHFVFAMAF